MKRMNHTLASAVIAATAVLFGTASMPLAQEVVTDNDSGVGARAMGMGGAQIGAVNDMTAIVSNPAALARLKRPEIQLGLNLWKRDIDTSLRSAQGTGKVSSSTDFSGLGTIGGAYPVPTDRGSLVFAAAYNRVKDFSGRLRVEGYTDGFTDGYIDVPKGNFYGESIEDGSLGIYSLAGAMDVSPNVSIGASIDIWNGDYTRDNHKLLNDRDDPYSQLDIYGADDDITAVSLKPAFLYFQENFRLGGFIRLPMTFHIDERWYDEGYVRDDGEYFQLYEYIDPTSPFNDIDDGDKLTYKIKAPMQFGLGVALGHQGGTILAVDINYENWKQAKIEYPSDYFQEPNYFLDKYRTTLTWKVGLEQPIPHIGGVVRAGYMRNPLTFKGPRGDDTAPITVSNERDYLTFGFGTRLDDSFGIDVGYTHGFWSSKENPRTDEESRNSVFVALTYRAPGK